MKITAIVMMVLIVALLAFTACGDVDLPPEPGAGEDVNPAADDADALADDVITDEVVVEDDDFIELGDMI